MDLHGLDPRDAARALCLQAARQLLSTLQLIREQAESECTAASRILGGERRAALNEESLHYIETQLQEAKRLNTMYEALRRDYDRLDAEAPWHP